MADNQQPTLYYTGPEMIPAIMPVMQRAFAPEFGEGWNAQQCESMLLLPRVRLLIASAVNDDVTGFAISRAVLDEEELLLIAVDPDRRRAGIGNAMMQTVIATAKADGIHRLFLEVRESNGAREFYSSFGFTAIGRRQGYYRGQNRQLHDAISCHLFI
jgi:ribosomal-protein-alanine N-acetyltransferase